MNFADSEVVASVLSSQYQLVTSPSEADLILVNTCSVRDNAEQRVFNRLNELTALKKKNKHLQIGLIGCMASRFKDDLFAKTDIDLIAGPDAYRNLPQIIDSENAVNIDVTLSKTETYEDILPIRYADNKVSAFVSVMRGCNNFCAYCVVPYTRGRERSRASESIIAETEQLFQTGYREVTLLGQNVNSYNYQNIDFAELMEKVAKIDPLLRVRFATSHPKDLSPKLLQIMAKYPNICKSIHLPAQSGSTAILQRMNRKYTRENYLEKISLIRQYLPQCGLSTDLIAGFCTETETDHLQTLSLMKEVAYDYAFTFKYSPREGTFAYQNIKDDVPEDVKIKRLQQIIDLQQNLSLKSNQKDVGKIFEVLTEGYSKRSKDFLFGRTSTNKVVVFPALNHKIGEYVVLKITNCSAATLFGEESAF
jgi:tRNA-2-methylthio-N6-dimethylallyladenosine synthase